MLDLESVWLLDDHSHAGLYERRLGRIQRLADIEGRDPHYATSTYLALIRQVWAELHGDSAQWAAGVEAQYVDGVEAAYSRMFDRLGVRATLWDFRRLHRTGWPEHRFKLIYWIDPFILPFADPSLWRVEEVQGALEEALQLAGLSALPASFDEYLSFVETTLRRARPHLFGLKLALGYQRSLTFAEVAREDAAQAYAAAVGWSQSRSETEPQSRSQSQSESESHCKPRPQSPSQSVSQTLSESPSQCVSESQPRSQSQSESESQPQAQARSRSQAQAQSEPQSRAPALRDFQDFMVRWLFHLAGELDLPLQIHASFGGPGSHLRLGNNDPSQLQALLEDPRNAATRVVLLHGAYPFVSQAAVLAWNYPRVWLDFSVLPTLFGPSLARWLTEWLELLPRNKLLYGSDASSPEEYATAARNARRQIAVALDTLHQAGLLSIEGASDLAERICHRNAVELYGIGDV